MLYVVGQNLTLHMTSEGLGDMFNVDFADTCGEKFPLTLIGG